MRIGRTISIALLLAVSALPSAGGPAGAATTPPSGSAVVAYVNGTAIRWTGQVLPLGGSQTYPWGTDPNAYEGGVTSGVGGGASGIVALGMDGNLGRASAWRSRDGGATWTETTAGGSFGTLVARRGVYVTYGQGIRSSTDGTTWGPPRPGIGGSWGVVAAGLTGFVVLSRWGASTRSWYSSDGRTWHLSPYTTGLTGLCPGAIAASASRAVAFGTLCGDPGRRRLLVTADGRTWRSVAVPWGMRIGTTLSYAGSRFVAIGPYGTYPNDGTAVWLSTDGVSWVRRSFLRRLGVAPDVVGSVVKFGSGWIAVGFGNADAGDCSLRTWKTSDLVHWSRMSLPDPGYSGGYCTRAVQAAVTGGRIVVGGVTSGPDPTAPLIWVGELTAGT